MDAKNFSMLERIALNGEVTVRAGRAEGSQQAHEHADEHGDEYAISVYEKRTPLLPPKRGGRSQEPLIGVLVHDDELEAQLGVVLAAVVRGHAEAGRYVITLTPGEVVGIRGEIAARLDSPMHRVEHAAAPADEAGGRLH